MAIHPSDGADRHLSRPRSLDCAVRALDDVTKSTDADVELAHQIREVLYRSVQTALPTRGEHMDAEDVRRLNELAAGPMPVVSLTSGGAAVHSGGFSEVATVLARDAIGLIGSDDRDNLKECANTECTRLFVDLSRGRSRRWCGMAQCGNRAKSADYRRRRKQQPPA